jgi:peptide/nickel transport system substrate-binding protein
MLNPVFMDGGFQFLNPLYRALAKTVKSPEGSYTLAPDLATSWDLSQDGLSWIFHLRKDVKWSDGVPFTSADVKMTYDAVLDPDTGASDYADLSDAVRSVETPDNYTVVINLKKPSPHIPTLLSDWHLEIVPKHILGNVPHAKWREHETNTIAPAPGTGPFRFVSWKKEEYMEEEANPYYYGTKAFDKFIVQVIPEASVAFSALEGGKIDMLYSVYARYAPGEVKRLQQVKGVHVEPVDRIGHTFLALNWNHPFLGNKYVRHAIANAIPYDHIINDLMYGLARPANSPIHPATWAYDPNVPFVDYNLDKAKDYLAKADYAWPPKTVEVQATGAISMYLGAGIVVGIIVGAALAFVASRRKTETKEEEAKHST